MKVHSVSKTTCTYVLATGNNFSDAEVAGSCNYPAAVGKNSCQIRNLPSLCIRNLPRYGNVHKTCCFNSPGNKMKRRLLRLLSLGGDCKQREPAFSYSKGAHKWKSNCIYQNHSVQETQSHSRKLVQGPGYNLFCLPNKRWMFCV